MKKYCTISIYFQNGLFFSQKTIYWLFSAYYLYKRAHPIRIKLAGISGKAFLIFLMEV